MASILLSGLATVDFVFQMDTFPTEPIKYRARDASIVGGGCAANAAVAVARLGGDARLATRLGDDAIGDMIVAGLEADKVDTGVTARQAGARSGYSTIIVDARGERQIVNFRGERLSDDADAIDAAPAADGYLGDSRWDAGALRALHAARRNGVPGVLDAEPPVDPEAVVAASHVAFSREGLEDYTGLNDLGSSLRAAAASTDAWVCVTDGAGGVHHLVDGEVRNIPAFQVDVVDTLGAGDIWHGAFVLALAEGVGTLAAVRFANGAAALKCRQFGGRLGAPRRHELDQFLKERATCN